MIAHVINLDRVPDRAAFMAAQCEAAGIPMRRFPAIDAATAPDLTARYRPASWGPYWAMTPTEIAVTESHRALWQQIVDDDRPAAIFEDDILIAPGAGAVLADLAGQAGSFDLVKLDSVAGRIRLGPEHVLAGHRLRPIVQVLPSAAAYMLSPRGAADLLRRSQTYCDHLDDLITRPAPGFRAFQLWPSVAVQCMFADPAALDGLPPSIAESERTQTERRTTARPDKGPPSYRALKELRRLGLRLARSAWSDGRLTAQGGLIGQVPLARGLPDYRGARSAR